MGSQHSPKTATSSPVTATSRSFELQFLHEIQRFAVNACAKLVEGVHGYRRAELSPSRIGEFMLQRSEMYVHYTSYFSKTDDDQI